MQKLSEAAPAGSVAWTEPPAQPPGEGRGAGLDQASHQELHLAFEGQSVSSIELCDQQGLGCFCGLSLHLLKALQFCMPQKQEFTMNTM